MLPVFIVMALCTGTAGHYQRPCTSALELMRGIADPMLPPCLVDRDDFCLFVPESDHWEIGLERVGFLEKLAYHLQQLLVGLSPI